MRDGRLPPPSLEVRREAARRERERDRGRFFGLVVLLLACWAVIAAVVLLCVRFL